jgi:hypothetical protein
MDEVPLFFVKIVGYNGGGGTERYEVWLNQTRAPSAAFSHQTAHTIYQQLYNGRFHKSRRIYQKETNREEGLRSSCAIKTFPFLIASAAAPPKGTLSSL